MYKYKDMKLRCLAKKKRRGVREKVLCKQMQMQNEMVMYISHATLQMILRKDLMFVLCKIQVIKGEEVIQATA